MKLNIRKISALGIIVLFVMGSFLLYINERKIENINFEEKEHKISALINEDIFINRNLQEEILNEENSQYDSLEYGNIILMRYVGNKEIVIIPEEIDGYAVKKINSDAFKNSDNLEIIKIPKKVAENIETIENFQINDSLLNNEGYVIYTTTKTYNEEYLKYIKLTDEEKAKWEIIPQKFITLLINEDKDDSTLKDPTSTSVPKKFDLRNYISINVESQGATGLCYAYATNTSIETNIALNYNIKRNFSEIHLGVKSKQGSGGWFLQSYLNYLQYGYGPVEEKSNTILSKDYIVSNKYNYGSTEKYIYDFCSDSSKKADTDEWKNAVSELDKVNAEQEFYVMSYKSFPFITGNDKKISSNKDTINNNRDLIKKHITEYGSVWAYIANPSNENICATNENMVVMCSRSANDIANSAHAVSLIGWDDNFSHNNFPSEWNITEDGAYLALNSWGNWGNNRDGTFWISYQDFYVETQNYGIVDVSKGKVSLNNNKKVEIKLSNDTYEYNEMPRTPTVYLIYNGEEYKQGIDFTVNYIDNINAGTAKVEITGIGRFEGTVTKNFIIKQGNLSVTAKDYEATYNGKNHEIKIEVQPSSAIIKYGYKENECNLSKIPEYKNAGNYKLYYEATDNENNKIKGCINIKINSKNLQDVLYTVNSKNNTYNGTKQKLLFSLKDSEYVLKDEQDYIAKYSNNVNAGIANINIEGKGNYTGNLYKTFEIKKAIPIYTVPTGLTVKAGAKLKDVKLPNGFSWEDNLDKDVGNLGYNTFKCTYTPQDLVNYKVITGIRISIKVNKFLEASISKYYTKVLEDEEIFYIKGIKSGTTLQEIIENIETNGKMKCYDKNGKEITNYKEIAKTGIKVIIEQENEKIEYRLVVLGDNNGDGVFSSIDLLKMSRYLAKIDTNLEKEYLEACDVYNDNQITTIDLLKMSRINCGIESFN